MSKPKNEAERLLNTIVSSRARLAAMRGDSVGSVEPSLEAELSHSEQSAPQVDGQKEFDEHAMFDDLPAFDEDTDISEPPLILGIDEHADEEESYEFSISPSSDPLSSDDATIPVVEADHQGNPAVPNDFPEADEYRSGPEPGDPFSFIDLIPPSTPEEPAPQLEEEAPLNTPPPVRDRPLMPLPVGLATCAPKQTETQPRLAPTETAPTETAPTETAQPQLEQPSSTLPTQDMSLVVIEDTTSAAGLSQPREVTPRLLDPDRSRLEVDVIEDHFVDDEPLTFETDVPQLTTSSVTEQTPSRTTQPEADATTLFDSISAGFDAMRQGNIRAAVVHFSDVLDWDHEQIESRLARGRCRRDLGDTAGAMSDFLQSQAHAPHSPEPHVEMGDLFFARKDYSRAIAHYDDALELHPEHAMALCRRGISHHHTRRPSQAIEDLKQAARVDPNIPNISRYVRMVSTRR